MDADGSRAETVADFDGQGQLRDKTTTSAAADDSIANCTADVSANGTVIDSTTTLIDADGLGRDVQVDLMGDGTYDAETVHRTVVNGDGSRTETITGRNHDGSQTSATTIVTTEWRARASGSGESGGVPSPSLARRLSVDARARVSVPSGPKKSRSRSRSTGGRTGASRRTVAAPLPASMRSWFPEGGKASPTGLWCPGRGAGSEPLRLFGPYACLLPADRRRVNPVAHEPLGLSGGLPNMETDM